MRSAVFNGSSLNSSPSVPYCLFGLTCLTRENLILCHCEHRAVGWGFFFVVVVCVFFSPATNSTFWITSEAGSLWTMVKQQACLFTVTSCPTFVFLACRLFPRSRTQLSNLRPDQRTVSGIWSCSRRACLHTPPVTHQSRMGMSDSTFFLLWFFFSWTSLLHAAM